MAYRCVHCTRTYSDGSRETLTGCACGSKFFFYIKDEKLAEIAKENPLSDLSTAEKDKIEDDIRDIAGITENEDPVFLDFESVTVLHSGKYLIDIAKLFANNKPKVYKLEDGKYIIDLQLKTESKSKPK